MKRNPELLRQIMLAAEEKSAGDKLHASELNKICDNPHELADHAQQLIEMGLLNGVVHDHGRETNPNITITRVTSSGHEFLDAMRDETIWKKVKESVMKPAASWTIGLALEYAKREIATRLAHH